MVIPTLSGRVSATDRLSWWFRPTTEGHDPWESFFEQEPTAFAETTAFAEQPAAAATASRPAVAEEPPGRRAALRLLLAEPDDELIDADGEAVVTCLYDFVHAVGRGDVATAIDECVHPDYHAIEDDAEIDRDGLAAQLRAQLDRLRGWHVDVSLVEIPEPILHPDGILVYAELQIEARKEEARRTIVHRRLAVFRQGRDRSWRIATLSPV
jgi:ketosteroid isomerase-like protein